MLKPGSEAKNINSKIRASENLPANAFSGIFTSVLLPSYACSFVRSYAFLTILIQSVKELKTKKNI